MFSQEKSRNPDPIAVSRQDAKKLNEYFRLNIEYLRNPIYIKKTIIKPTERSDSYNCSIGSIFLLYEQRV